MSIHHPSRAPRSRSTGQRGQTLIFFAVTLVIIFGMAAVAVDGGYGLVQERRAQNGADFGSIAGTKMLTSLCQGGNPPSNGAVYAEIQSVINRNSADTQGNWTAHYLDANGNDTGFVVTNDFAAFPPNNACGTLVTLNPQWTPYIANIVGSTSLKTTASAKSVNVTATTKSIGIVALDEVNPHQVLGGGSGNFDVFGTIFANSAVPYHPWDGTRYVCSDGQHSSSFNYAGDSHCKSMVYVDVVDAKDGSSLVLHGTMQSVSGNYPVDWCFGDPGPGWTGNSNGGPANIQPTTNPHSPDPFNNATGGACGNVTLKYDFLQPGASQLTDPLDPSNGGVDDPFQTSGTGAGYTDSLCPGENTPPARTVPSTPDGSGVYQLSPGEYSSNASDGPVVLVGKNVHFNDCGSGYPGVYRFDKGLDLRPGSGQSATGSNVMIAVSAPITEPGNVPGSVVSGNFVASGPGNGAPCFPQKPAIVKNSSSQNETDSTHQCGGTSSLPNGPYYGVVTYFIGPNDASGNKISGNQDTNTYGTGTNFSVMLGGQGTVTLDSPTSGIFRGIALFQDRSTQANFGLDAEPKDKATVTLGGLAYNASQPCLGFPQTGTSPPGCTSSGTLPTVDPYNFWDVGIPFRQGGVLQAGLGTGTGYPNTSAGSVTVNGPCVVGDFNTDGGTTIVIDGSKNTVNIPGVLGSGNPPISG